MIESPQARLGAMVREKAVPYLDRKDAEAAAREVFASVALDLISKLDAAEAQVEALTAERDAWENALPTTWLDPLLTGPKAAIGNPPYGCDDIEHLFNAIRARAALKLDGE